jgi:3-hydroxyanthranilate 3,4-dioxygenase
VTVVPPVIDFAKWVAEHEHLLKPPVNNRQMWEPMGDFIVQVVGGPNQRTDIHEGGMWMLPRDIPHSPQRPDADSIGIVIERIREEGTEEEFCWFCPKCAQRLHTVRLQVRDIVADLPPVFEAFYSDQDARTCDNCDTVHPGKGRA